MKSWIKIPIGESVSWLSYWRHDHYITEESAQFQYRVYIRKFLDLGLEPYTFADWLEAQGVRLL